MTSPNLAINMTAAKNANTSIIIAMIRKSMSCLENDTLFFRKYPLPCSLLSGSIEYKSGHCRRGAERGVGDVVPYKTPYRPVGVGPCLSSRSGETTRIIAVRDAERDAEDAVPYKNPYRLVGVGLRTTRIVACPRVAGR